VSRRGKEKPGSGRTFEAPAGFRDSPQPALSAGEVVSSTYHIRRDLLRTESGQVFVAWDMLLERAVALKLAWRDPGAPSLVGEARLCARVAHEAAVAIYGVGTHRGVEYVAAERTEGTILRDHAAVYQSAGTAMPPSEVIETLRAVARAVAAAHGQGIALGDVSPETVLITTARRIVLGRLSLSQVPSVGADGTSWAPEVITGQCNPADPEAAVAIDLYGLGCTAVELATGRPPYLGANVKGTQLGHVHERPPMLGERRPDLPVELSDLVAELLAKTPSARPPSAEAVVAQLESIAERASATRRILRVLVVDHDQDRVRALWSVIRRAHPRASVDAATDGNDAAAKLRRDHPDVVIVEAGLIGPMNALELFMYVSGLEDIRGTALVAIADQLDPRDAALFGQMGVSYTLVRSARFVETCSALIRKLALAARSGYMQGRITVSG